MISHQHKFIFRHITKNGGCSVEAAFGIDLDFHNPEQVDDVRHRKLVKYQRLFPHLFDSYFKFGFVRNPWDRAVSKYFFHCEKRKQMAADLEAAEQQARALEVPKAREKALAKLERRRAEIASSPYSVPFAAWLEEKSEHERQRQEPPTQLKWDEPYFDFIGRFERFNEDFQVICQRLGVQKSLPHVNRSAHAHYSDYYDDYTRTLVAERSAHDIERFGYASATRH